MGRIYEKLVGTVRLEICGTFPESFLNCCALEGIELWQLQSVDQYTLWVTTYETELGSIEKIAQKCMCSLKVMEIDGGSKNKGFLRRRKWLLLFLAAASIMIMLSSLFIWEIEVRGNERISTVRILRELSRCDVREGSFWPAISPELVRSRMMTEIPELGWMTVNINGSRAIVLINERQDKPEIYSESEAADIIAKENGIVRKAFVLNGNSLVMPGDTVSKGQLLVSGYMESIAGDTRLVCSKASIMADTCHEIRMLFPSEITMKTEPANSFCRFALKFGKKRINLYLRGRNNIDECDKIISEYKLGFDGLFAVPVSIVKEEIVKYRKETVNTDLSEFLCDQQLEKLQARISGSIKHSSYQTYETEKLCYVSLYVQCYEDIAHSRRIL